METEFLKHLRAALNHLYNLEQLRGSPLIAWFRLSSRFDAPAVLQHLLVDEIEALRPRQSEALYPEKKKVFEILQFRYVQQFSQAEVAHHIGVSDRQFRREQDEAIASLGLSIWNRHGPSAPEGPATAAEAAPAGGAAQASAFLQEEWDWLRGAHSESIPELAAFVQKILDLMRAVGQQYGASLEFRPPAGLPDLAVHPVAFRQMMLNLLQVAIHQAGSGQVRLEIEVQPPFIEFSVRAGIPAGPKGSPAHAAQDANLLETAAHLAGLCGGRLEVMAQAEGFAWRLSLPSVEGLRVLVVDDNPEIIELLRRYAGGTRYTVIGTSDPERAVEMAESSAARIIVIDVMMPRIDGWELLGRLRNHPQTAGIPVIVLTILAQVDLATSLGARKLVLKPVTRETFLAALDEVLAHPDSGSR